jgi:putative DNA primase/helicase
VTVNILDAFRQAMQNAGIEPPSEIIADGNLHRFTVPGDKARSDNGWYILHNDAVPAGQFGCWKRGISETWCSKEYKSLTPEEKARYTVDMEAAKAARDAELQRIQAECRVWCADAWEKAKDATSGNPYLQKKGVHSYGLKAFKDSLMIPLKDTAGTIHGLQFISPDGSKKFKTGTNKAGHFYKIGKSKDKTVLISEGYATGASLHQATGHAVVIAFAAGNLKPVTEVIRAKCPDFKVIICADDDHATEGNPGLTKATEAARAIAGLLAVPVFQDPATRGTDFNDLHQTEGLEAVLHCIESAQLPEAAKDELQAEETLQQEVARLATMGPLEYERIRKTEATRLGIERVSALDNAVKAARKEKASADDEMFPTDEPWHDPVDGRQLVNELAATFERFSVLPKGSAITAALWSILAYTFDAWGTLPLLAVVSPEKRCGKTTFLTTLASLCIRALPVSNISPAAVYRAIEAFKPTLLIDEGDTFLKDNEELRGVINSGHTKGAAFVIRCEGDDNKPVKFSTWCPKAIAMIGTPPDTIQDRSITVNLRRKLPEERTTPHGEEHAEDFDRLRSMILRWIEDNGAVLRLAKPGRLSTSNDRQADNWRPLLAIAQVAGCEAEAREAASLAIGDDREEPPAKIQLLQDIRAIFEESGDSRISSAALVKELVSLEDRPWCEWKHGKPLTSPTLARLLRPFGIHPKTIRFPNERVKGYEFETFRDVFTRYTPLSNRDTVTSQQYQGVREFSNRDTEEDVTLSNQANYAESLQCHGVTDSTGGSDDNMGSEDETLHFDLDGTEGLR